jgi:hypothetical protein
MQDGDSLTGQPASEAEESISSESPSRHSSDKDAKTASTNLKCMADNSSKEKEVKTKILSKEDIAMCERVYQLSQGNIEQVVQITGFPRASIEAQAELKPFKFELVDPKSLRSQLDSKKKNKSCTQHITKQTADGQVHYTPCSHVGPCTRANENCTCMKNGHWCTKYCLSGEFSSNLFQGCNCTGKCNQKYCPCFAAGRECDPDLCKKCNTCTDPPNKPAGSQSCRNDNISMRRHVRTLLGVSDVDGWGLFTRDALKKGDFVHEYVGEMLRRDDTEKQGIDDDKNKSKTYLFELTSEYDVDAKRKGNKTRYINHSRKGANVKPRILFAKGDYRIGFFAIKDIAAQSEVSRRLRRRKDETLLWCAPLQRR